MKKFGVFDFVKTIMIPGIALVSFGHFIVELFGQTIPNIFTSFFREAAIVVIVGAALLFAAAWLVRALPHNNKSKNYHLICFDVFGKEVIIDGPRTEFKTNDVAWSFIKEYKKRHPLYNFALVTETLNSEKKTIIGYL